MATKMVKECRYEKERRKKKGKNLPFIFLGYSQRRCLFWPISIRLSVSFFLFFFSLSPLSFHYKKKKTGLGRDVVCSPTKIFISGSGKMTFFTEKEDGQRKMGWFFKEGLWKDNLRALSRFEWERRGRIGIGKIFLTSFFFLFFF